MHKATTRLFCICILIINSVPLYATSNCLNWLASCETTTTLRIWLFNSYSGSIAFNTWTTSPRIILSGQLRVGTSTVLIDLSATDTSNFILNGWDNSLTGQGSGAYMQTVNATVSQEQFYDLQAEFDKNREFYFSNIVRIWVDLSPPTAPISTNIPDGSTMSGTSITFVRNVSTDSGVGLLGYKLYLSLNPLFSGTIPLFTSDTSLTILSNDMPEWTIFYKIVSVDYLWHEATSSLHYFNNQQPTYISQNNVMSYVSSSAPNSQTKTPQDIINNDKIHNSAPINTIDSHIDQPFISNDSILKDIVFDNQTPPPLTTPVIPLLDNNPNEDASLTIVGDLPIVVTQSPIERPYLRQAIIDNYINNPIPNRILPDSLVDQIDRETMSMNADIYPIDAKDISKVNNPFKFQGATALINSLAYISLTITWLYAIHLLLKK